MFRPLKGHHQSKVLVIQCEQRYTNVTCKLRSYCYLKKGYVLLLCFEHVF